MTLLEKAMQAPNEKAGDKFINMALADVEEEISSIENRFHVCLIGDRRDFEKARRDWKHLTKGQVAYQVSAWKNGIRNRYKNK